MGARIERGKCLSLPCAQDNEGVYEIRKTRNTEILNADNPRAGTGTNETSADGGLEAGVARAADDADTQDSEDVEAENTIENQPRHAGDRVPRVAHLACCDGDEIRAGNVLKEGLEVDVEIGPGESMMGGGRGSWSYKGGVEHDGEKS